MIVVVIGHGMVGHKLVELLDQLKASDDQVIVFGEEPRAAYDRVHLSSYFSGTTADQLSLVPSDFFAERPGLSLRTHCAVTGIDPLSHEVVLDDGSRQRYDRLVMATGSRPFVPAIAGADGNHCFVYRTIEDLDRIAAAASTARSGVVIGGGLLGLEAAKALTDLGLETHVVEFATRLMAVQLDDAGARMLRKKIEALGVHVHLGKSTVEIADGELGQKQLLFSDGQRLETDLIVFSAGIRPRDDLAGAAGIAIAERGGIAIDEWCRTSAPDVYAIGECAAFERRCYGLVAPGYRMADVAAHHILGRPGQPFTGADMSTKLKLMGVDVASFGDPHGQDPDGLNYTYLNERSGVYKKITVGRDNQLLGGILVGDATDYGTLLQLMLAGMALPGSPEALVLPESTGKQPGLGPSALPGSAMICSCNSVSKTQLCEAIDAGQTSVADLKACTRAGTTCGGCVPLMGQLLKAELAERGFAVSDHLCEHFPFSRQGLYDLVRLHGIRDFDALLKAHGQGMGCDICKPTVASILASCWNEPVLLPKHARLQDSNDYFLANLQKNGTYSIVPRVPGGEITPDGLIAIGAVAKKFGLYTKITGGQRIDLFGAQVHELPAIWKELIDAGFESGHAYGKALRTVKSCVGSTWCRYGVQDSTSLAIQLENRYRGVRAPHKIKFGVSGCTRECAEAQSKDVGVIATEKGWSLYVGGNGGMKPRHADLLAADLDEATLIRTIDRFLMFYIKTADRLQRTAGWLESLEGGLDHVRAVVLDDSLGIGSELETHMAYLVATYECEWKSVINDPVKLKRFRTFVNSDAADDGVRFELERNQIRPALAPPAPVRERATDGITS